MQVADRVPSVAVITELPASTPVTSTCLLSIFSTVAFASVPLENVIVGLAWNGVLTSVKTTFCPAVTEAVLDSKAKVVAGTLGADVQNTIPVCE